jgi:hypothetical protein
MVLGTSLPQPSPDYMLIDNSTNNLVNQPLTSRSSTFLSAHNAHPNTPPRKRSKHYLLPHSPGELVKLAQGHARDLARLGWEQFFYKQQ